MTENPSICPTISPLPGFGLPLNQEPKALFPSALDKRLCNDYDHKARLLCLTLRELTMVKFMNQVTDKMNWESKVFDETITNKWTSEVMDNSDLDFTQKMADYCIDELKYKAQIFKETGCISIYNGDVIKSDTAITPELQSSLKAAVAPLENVPKNQKDWHPGSNEQVLDLVHPSLFPLVYGVSRILKDDTVGLDDFATRCGEGQVIGTPEDTPCYQYPHMSDNEAPDSEPYSLKFQWLPCDIDISGDRPKIISYINNLHPKYHKELYRTIECIMEKVIPVWNATLTPLKRHAFSRRVEYDTVKYDKEALHKFMEVHGPKRLENESNIDYIPRKSAWKWDRLPEYLLKPNPASFSLPELPLPGEELDLKRDYGNSGLQVIVKLANIHLTPDNPKYNGGAWHVEGQLNEHICATAIYYYDCENVTPSRLAFRQSFSLHEIHDSRRCRQYERWWLEPIFGLQNGDSSVQDLGTIETREGRLITFPNILLHQVQPMELIDRTRPGHRKILAFFLVDPNIKVISTANIPCQRRDWWGELVAPELSHRGKLPVELLDKMLQDVEGFPLALDEAKKMREELMEERTKYVLDYQQPNFTGSIISLCEH